MLRHEAGRLRHEHGCGMSAGAELGSFGHLARRLLSSLSPRPPTIADEAWARRWLNPGERLLWSRQSKADRRHAVGVARAVATALGDADGAGVRRQVMAAALLHDVGKIEAGLGTFSRVAATALVMVRGHRAVAAWAGPLHPDLHRDPGPPRGWKEQVGRYVTHDRRGGRLLDQAGSAAFTATWAREHHLPERSWTLDPALAKVLKAADGD